MIPRGFLRQQRGCGSMLSAAVLCSLVSLAYCGTRMLEQTPAQDRFFESILGGGGWGSPPPPPAPPMNIPDVAGFGMYPLWKFHKFDGLSLRPVPYGVDIGSGIPPSPVPPAYPTGFLSSPQPQTPANPSYHSPPASQPAANYEAAPPSQNAPQQQSYGNAPPAQSYGNSAPPQQQQSYGNAAPQQNYGASAPSYGMPSSSSYPSEQPANSYQPNTIQFSYSPVAAPVPAQKYNEAPQAYSAPAQKYNEAPQTYSAPAAPIYGEPQSYGPPQSSYAAPYDGVQYGSGNGVSIQFSAAPQDYGMQQQQQQPSNYGSATAGSYQVPSYTAIESPMSVSYPVQELKSMPMETGYGGGGFMKRNSAGYEKDTSKRPAESEMSTKP